MDMGRLRNRVEFWGLEKVRQPTGTFKDTWVQKFSAWAEVISIGGEEGRVAAAQSSLVKYRLTLRYRKDVLPAMVVKNIAEGRFMHIRAVRDPDGKKNLLELSAEWKQGQTEPS